jgi:hypothetical protein
MISSLVLLVLKSLEDVKNLLLSPSSLILVKLISVEKKKGFSLPWCACCCLHSFQASIASSF